MFENYNDVLNVKEACSALKVGRNSMYKLLQSGKIKSVKIGKKYLIPKKSLISFISAA